MIGVLRADSVGLGPDDRATDSDDRQEAPMATTPKPTLDQDLVQQFAGRIFQLYTGGMLTYMVDLGHRTGLFTAAAEGPATSGELAERAGLHERYVLEWLGAMVTGGIIELDPANATYRLPPEHAACLTGDTAANLAPYSQLNTHLARYVQRVAEAFRQGGGVPYEEYQPEFTEVMDELGRGGYNEQLLAGYLPLSPGLTDRLASGARVADVCCGSGHAMALMAGAYPSSRFVGYDLDEGAIARARAEAAAAGLTNLRFEVLDAARLTVDQPLDVVFVFDAIHDQADPAAVLERIHAALAPGGLFFMKEPRVSSSLEDNVANPFAPLLYSVSTLHCLTVSLAEDGAGLGTAWGEQRALRMLADAGFPEVEVHEAPGDPIDGIFLSRKPMA
jgi:SAM-dependent methyltransferase